MERIFNTLAEVNLLWRGLIDLGSCVQARSALGFACCEIETL
jgi:hypothetical protein